MVAVSAIVGIDGIVKMPPPDGVGVGIVDSNFPTQTRCALKALLFFGSLPYGRTLADVGQDDLNRSNQ